MTQSAHMYITQRAGNWDAKCQKTGITHIPKAVCEHEDITVL